MIGRTHGVHAEPITLGFKLAGWYAELQRQHERLQHAREDVRVGKISGAVGTHAHVPPQIEEAVLTRLGLRVDPVSTQVVGRDRHAAFVATLAGIGATIDRFATEIRHLQRTEVRELEEPFDPQNMGSSAMPHKRNPHESERLSGLARLLRSYVSAALENVVLWHERDISHSSVERVILPDACIVLDFMLNSMTIWCAIGWCIRTGCGATRSDARGDLFAACDARAGAGRNGATTGLPAGTATGPSRLGGRDALAHAARTG
jgi:adenylosuccinate lyase